jgi:prevent-host-death family protein
MGYVSYMELPQNLKKHLDSVCDSRAPLVVTRQNGEAVVMLSLAEYESLEGDPSFAPGSDQRGALVAIYRRGGSGAARRA